jgi:hypothetical protein
MLNNIIFNLYSMHYISEKPARKRAKTKYMH